MKPSHQFLSTLLVAALPFGQAQTWSECNPLKASCPPNRALKSSSFSTNFASEKGLPPGWVREKSAGNVHYGRSGAEFIMAKQGESPGLNTDFYFLFGYVEVKMKAAPGTGVISTYVLQSDDLDEIDYVWRNPAVVEKAADCLRRSLLVPTHSKSRPTTSAKATTERGTGARNTTSIPKGDCTRTP
jgi:Glycosyl hydrolases family 16